MRFQWFLPAYRNTTRPTGSKNSDINGNGCAHNQSAETQMLRRGERVRIWLVSYTRKNIAMPATTDCFCWRHLPHKPEIHVLLSPNWPNEPEISEWRTYDSPKRDHISGLGTLFYSNDGHDVLKWRAQSTDSKNDEKNMAWLRALMDSYEGKIRTTMENIRNFHGQWLPFLVTTLKIVRCMVKHGRYSISEAWGQHYFEKISGNFLYVGIHWASFVQIKIL